MSDGRSVSETARATGSIIAAVAVFEIHMLRKAVAIMNPRINLEGAVPKSVMTFSAIRRCSPDFSIAAAIKKPPMKRKISSRA